MRILLYYFSELGGLGGVNEVVRTLASGFVEAGCPTGILEMGKNRRPRRFIEENIPVWTMTESANLDVRRPRSWASALRSMGQLLDVIRKFRPNIVNVHYPTSQLVPAIFASYLMPRWRLVVTVHNSDLRIAPVNAPYVQKMQKRLFRRADGVSAVGRGLLKDAERLYPCIAGKGVAIFNGVNPEWFEEVKNVSCERRYLLFAGRLEAVKGVDLLLQSWRKIESEFPRVELWLAGDGSDRSWLVDKAESLRLDSVRFLGTKKAGELKKLYQGADAVVLPSRREGLPMTLIEAGASGAIRIASRIPGNVETIEDGKTGFLVKPESAEALAKCIGTVLRLDERTRGDIKQATRDSMLRDFSRDAMISGYLHYFERIRANPGFV